MQFDPPLHTEEREGYRTSFFGGQWNRPVKLTC